MSEVSPDHIMQTGMGFWPAKVLLSALELGLFTELGGGAATGMEIQKALGLHPRGVGDFLDSLVALGFLEKEKTVRGMEYRNSPSAGRYLDREKPDYIGGFLEMCNSRLYRYWGDLTEALKTGQPQNEVKHSGEPLFDTLYRDPSRLEEFMNAMQGFSALNFRAFSEKFDFSPYKTLCDVGGANAVLSVTVAKQHPHLQCISYDLPAVEPIARKAVEAAGLSGRVRTVGGDFFKDPFPKVDLITMGMILHDWNLEKKKVLVEKAFQALPEGGALVAIESIIDDERKENAFGLMMSLNMLIEFGDAFDFTGADFNSWCTEAGFKSTRVIPLAGPASAAVAYK